MNIFIILTLMYSNVHSSIVKTKLGLRTHDPNQGISGSTSSTCALIITITEKEVFTGKEKNKIFCTYLRA